MFESAHKVKSRRVVPCTAIRRYCKDKEISDRLSELHDEISEKHSNFLNEIQKHCHITKGEDPNKGVGLGIPHRRSIFSQCKTGFYVAKGSGFNDWTKDSSWQDVKFEYNYKDSIRRFPIVKQPNSSQYSYSFVGGASSDLLETEFIGDLMLIDACRKVNVEPFCQFPLIISKPQELPLMHNGIVKIVERDEYCDDYYSNDKSDGNVLSLKDFQRLGIFYYWSINPIDRIPKNVPLLKHLPYEENKKRLNEIVIGFARTIAAFHKDGGRFSDDKMSPLSRLNVSITGTIHDMDTFTHSSLGETLPERKNDLVHAISSVTYLTHLYSYDIFLKSEKERKDEMRKLFIKEYKEVYKK